MAISDQASNDVDEAVDGTAMPSMLNLRDVLELVHYTFDDSALAQQDFIHPGHQPVFHVFLEFGDKLNAKGLQELFK